MAEVCFWIAAVLLAYACFGYPAVLLMAGFGRRRSTAEQSSETFTPSVSLIIAAHNEEAVIEAKMRNCLELDYPRDRLEILIVSDGSTDATNTIVERYGDRGIRLVAREQRAGKAEALNAVCPLARGEILILSDANGMYKSDAIRRLVRHFARPEVGCVSGALRYVDPNSGAAHRGESLFLRYDAWLKTLESRVGTVIGAFGGIFACRRSLFAPLDPLLPNDLETPLKVLLEGYEVLYDDTALCWEPASPRVGVEFGRHARISAQVYYGLVYWMRALLVSFRPMVCFSFLSKKVLRWISPFLLMILFVTPFALDGLFYDVIRWANLTILVLAGMGAVLYWRGISSTVFSVPFYAVIGNAAVAWGIVKCLLGHQGPTWSVVRDGAVASVEMQQPNDSTPQVR
jgi:biofilm PGA synthesis N-glycosyltransferase PgaC